MQRYLYEYQAPRRHWRVPRSWRTRNAAGNPNAMYRKPLSRKAYDSAGMVCDPLGMMDVAPYGDGAAAVILARSDLVPEGLNHALVRVTGSAISIDTLALHDRKSPLAFDAARVSVQRACRQAGILPARRGFLRADRRLFDLRATLAGSRGVCTRRGRLEAGAGRLAASGWQAAHPDDGRV